MPFQFYHNHELYLSHIDAEDVVSKIEAMDDLLKERPYANVAFSRNMYAGLFSGDPSNMRSALETFKDHYLNHDELGWNVSNVHRYNEEAFRKVSEDIPDLIEWGELMIKKVEIIISICEAKMTDAKNKAVWELILETENETHHYLYQSMEDLAEFAKTLNKNDYRWIHIASRSQQTDKKKPTRRGGKKHRKKQ